MFYVSEPMKAPKGRRSALAAEAKTPDGCLTPHVSRFILSLILFLLALLPRAYDLPRFVTADEAKWVYRSAQFLAALLRGDFPATSVNLTPAVTTTWLGSLGLLCYYPFNQAGLAQPFPAWLISLPEFRTELAVLVATRWPMVILTTLGVVAIYLLACKLFNPALAFIAAVFIALDPHTVALSRILGHDAPTAVFMTISLLLLFITLKRTEEQQRGEIIVSTPLPSRPSAPLLPLLLSGIAAGLAFLSKAPAFFLIPFTGLALLFSETRFFQKNRLAWLLSKARQMSLWLVMAYLTFVIFWPAAWTDPLGRPWAVIENGFLSATDQEEADEEGYWLVPNLGPFYYLVNGAFKLSPLVMTGAGLAVIFLAKQPGQPAKSDESRPGQSRLAKWLSRPFAYLPIHSGAESLILWLLLFVLLFTIFMTMSDKRSARYILPAFPLLALIAAYGWLELYRRVMSSVSRIGDQTNITFHVSEPKAPYGRFTFQSRRPPMGVSRFAFPILLTFAALITLLPYAPYYFTYFNPLVGGPYTAPHWVKIGWGEGLDQVGRFLQREGGLRQSRVGTAYASTVAPFFEGDLSNVTGDKLDYLVLYRKQVQSGEPSPTFIRYFEASDPIFSVSLNGIRYAEVYPGPALQLLAPEPRTPGAAPQPIAFRPLKPYGPIGQALEVEVVWPAGQPLPTTPTLVTVAPLATLKGEHLSGSPPALAEGVGELTRLESDLVISRHRLALPADLTPGPYALWVDASPLGELELRNFQIPAGMAPVQETNFARQIVLAAYQVEPNPDYIGLTLAWQAQTDHLPDYTVFVQLLNAETNERVAGIDTQPHQGEWPASRWVKDEVVVDEYLVAVPPDFPAGAYKLIVGLYRPDTGERLTLANGQDHWVLPWTVLREE